MTDSVYSKREDFDYIQTIPDRFNPFNNDTENRQFNQDYRKIVPQISVSGCVIPKEPSSFEKKNIRSRYNKVGYTLIFHTVVSNILAVMLSLIVSVASGNVMGDSGALSMSVGGISYLIANVSTFLLGCHMLNIPITEVFSKPDIKSKDLTKYVTTGWCFQGACSIIVTLLLTLFSYIGVNLMPDTILDNIDYTSIPMCVSTILYTCIIAPITEEMVFRGVVLRGLSTVSQRFGIVASAVLFGLLHGNVSQFIVATVLGILLGMVATKYNSILPTIVIHFFMNLAPTVLEMIPYSNDVVSACVQNGFYILMIIVGVVMLIINIRTKLFKLPTQNTHQRTRTLPLFLTSIGILIVIAMYIATFIMALMV